MIITEASPISNAAQPNFGAGCIWTKEQTLGWSKVVSAVHQAGSPIFLQLWHAGRAAHPQQTGEPSLAASSIAIRGTHRYMQLPHAVPKEMTINDIKLVKEEYKRAAKNAKEAGFDGIELQTANGFLEDGFLRDATNRRKDEYGGSVENRAKFPLELVDILINQFGSKRVGVKISPVGRAYDMYDSNPIETFSYFCTEL